MHTLNLVLKGLLGLAALLLPLAATPAAQKDRLNVVLILADDLGVGDLGCYGHPKFKTPHLDGLAREGARLTQFMTPMPYCAPTRGALLTGRYPFRNGLTRNPVPAADPGGVGSDHVGLETAEITLGQVFRDAGYATGCVGKWHLGHQPQFRPLRRGFDDYYGILYSNDMHRVELFDGDRMVEYPLVQATLTRRYTERALSFLDKHKDRPFFLYLPHAMPHKPLAVSEQFYGKSGAGLYGDVIAELDWSVGQVLAKLKELGLEGNTLVLFTSDNGPWYGGSTGGLRGMKGQNWEGGHRIPLLARWPGKIPPGHVSHEPALIMDLFTTALTAAGVPAPKGRVIDGKDILPLLSASAKSPHEALIGMRGDTISTVRSGPWKLHLVPPAAGMIKFLKPGDPWIDPRRPDGVRILAPYEQAHPSEFPGVRTGDTFTQVGLFNLTQDPAEQHNVADKHPEIVAQLRVHAERAQKEARTAPAPKKKPAKGKP